MGSDREAEKSHQKEKEKKKIMAHYRKLCKRTLKLFRKATEYKCLKWGVKEVVKT